MLVESAVAEVANKVCIVLPAHVHEGNRELHLSIVNCPKAGGAFQKVTQNVGFSPITTAG